MGVTEEKGLDRRSYDGLAMEQKIDIILSKQDFILSSFPYGVDHHKQLHITMEENRKENEALLRDLKHTIFKHGVMTLLLILTSLLTLGVATTFSSHMHDLIIQTVTSIGGNK